MEQPETIKMDVDIKGLPPSPPINELADALSKAQGEMKEPIAKHKVDFTHNGQRTKYQYADLADVMSSLRAPLSKYSLSIAHRIVKEEKNYHLETTLMHKSGQSLSSVYPLPDPNLTKPQQFGSVLTYARRYSVSALVGISSEEDNDVIDYADSQQGKASKTSPRSDKEEKQVTPPKAPVKNEAPATAAQITHIGNMVRNKGISTDIFRKYLTTCYEGVDPENPKGTIKKWQAEELTQLLGLEDVSDIKLMSEIAKVDKK